MKKIFSVALACILLLLAGCGYSEAELQSQYEKGYDKGFIDGSSSEREKNSEESNWETNDLLLEEEDINLEEFPPEENILDQYIERTGLKSLDYVRDGKYPESYVYFNKTIEMQRNAVGNTYLKIFNSYEYDLIDIDGYPFVIGNDDSGDIFFIAISEETLAECLNNYENPYMNPYIICEVKISSVASSINYYPEFEFSEDTPEFIPADEFSWFSNPYIDGEFYRTIFASCEKIHFINRK